MPDKDIIQPGDLILFRVGPTSSWLDRAIGQCQKWIGEDPPSVLEFCHVGIIGPGGNTVIEARWPKVKMGPLDLPDLLTRNPIDFYRVKDMNGAQAALVVAYASTQIGQWYDMAAIATFGFIQLGHAQVCSQYVWEWFLNGSGIKLCDWSPLISPDDIAGSAVTRRLNVT